jgi:uncharacterized protein
VTLSDRVLAVGAYAYRVVMAPPSPAWPHRLLDVGALRAQGWRPTPFRDFVLKVHQRCNLACDYCYVYTMADQTWRHRPVVMTEEVWRAGAWRIGEHARRHDLAEVRVILHGGEPLLAGGELLSSIAGAVRSALPAATRLEIGLQTNGLLLDEPTLRRLRDESILIGVSLDGTRADNDRHRRHANGRGSYDSVHRALTLLADPRYRPAYAGLLCTVDPRTDPVGCYHGLLGYQPPTIDFLLPHANWASPPRARSDGGTPYADWLVAVFDRWYSAARQETRVRLFEDIINLTLGGKGRSEQVGLSPVAVVVVETDGAVEQVDSLKSTYSGACATGLNVLTDPVDAALTHPGVVARQIGAAALCDTCRDCSVHRICGAGHYAHRFRPVEGFRNPSVYCADLRRLIEHIKGRIGADLTALAHAEAGRR